MPATFFDQPELYRSLLENLPIGVYILDRERRVRFWNPGAEYLTGHLAHEAIVHQQRQRRRRRGRGKAGKGSEGAAKNNEKGVGKEGAEHATPKSE